MTKRIDIKGLKGKRPRRGNVSPVALSEKVTMEQPKRLKTKEMREALLTGLRDLCQFHYLPFTTKFFADPDDIIWDFLRTLRQTSVGSLRAPLMETGAVMTIVPTFHFLTNYSHWQTGQIPSLKAMSNLSPAYLNHIHSIEESWSKNDPRITTEIMRYLNRSKDRNGRLKVRITLDAEKSKPEVSYTKDNKTLEYRIPYAWHQNWLRSLNIEPQNISPERYEIFDLEQYAQIENLPEDIPPFDVNEYASTSLKNARTVLEVAIKLFPAILKHSVYINKSIDLLYIFSNNTEVEHENSDVGLGGMFVLIDKSVLNGRHQDGPRIINYLSRLTDALSSRIITYYYAEEIVNMARKAATAQVMLRNSAHSIASHVISKMVLKSDVDAYYHYDAGAYIPDEHIRPSELDYSAEEMIAWFNSYLRSRMDFLADMATTVPFMEVSKMLKADVLAGLDKNQILLNYISGVSDFKYTIKISDQRSNKSADVPISVPNDILGYHSIYIVLENIIRNTAKHGSRAKGQEMVEFVVEVRDCKNDDSLYEVWIYDDCIITGERTLTPADIELYENRTGLRAREVMSNVDWLVFKQNIRIDDPILDPKTNALRNGAWGIIEMKVSAAYLRKISSDSLDHKRFKINRAAYNDPIFHTDIYYNRQSISTPNILKASKQNGALAYVMHIMKPKELLVVDETGDFYQQLSEKKDTRKASALKFLKDFGVRVLHGRDELPSGDRFSPSKTYPHPFLMVIPKGGQFETEKYFYRSDLYQARLPHHILLPPGTHADLDNNKWIIPLQDNELLKLIDQSDPRTSFQPDGQHHIPMLLGKIMSLHQMKISGFDGLIGKANSKSKISDNFNKYILGGRRVRKTLSVCLDHHGTEINNIFHGVKYKLDHYEAYPSTVKIFVNSAEEDQSGHPGDQMVEIPGLDLLSLCKIAASIFSKIVIVDERIQHAFKGDFKGSLVKPVDRWKLSENANVFVPWSIDLNKTDFEATYFEQLLAELKLIGERSGIKGIDYIVIHLGVIEKILATLNKDKQKADIEDFVQALTVHTGARVIITSGRGRPENLPDNVPFIAFSAISQYTLETPFKTYLFQSLRAARSNLV